MNKHAFLKQMKIYGDAYVNEEVGVATTTFSNKYIKGRPILRLPKRSRKGALVWSWTNNQYMVVNTAPIRKLEPLSKMLNNFSKPDLG